MTAATDTAPKKRELVIGGHSIFVRATDLPSDIVELLHALIAEWAAKYGRAAGLEASELTAIPTDDRGHVWMIVDRRYGQPTFPRAIVSIRSLIARFRGV